MYAEIVSQVLLSLGGASLITFAFAHFLGKVWADRIAKQTAAKFNLEIEDFRTRAAAELKENENFSSISRDTYQDFFKKRIDTYLLLLKIKNEYIEAMNEQYMHEAEENYANAYYSVYSGIRKLLIENQIYISNDLEKSFHNLRISASKYIREADMLEMIASMKSSEPHEIDEVTSPTYIKFMNETYSQMSSLMSQIENDVSQIRSRIEIDRSANKSFKADA